MQHKLVLKSKKLISLLVCVMMITATFPIHSLNNVVFADGDVKYAKDYKSLAKAIKESNVNNGGVYEIILTNDIIIKPDDKISCMDKSEGFIFQITNPEEDELSRKVITIKSDDKGPHKIQNLKKDVGLFKVEGQAGLDLNLENVVIDAGAEVQGNDFKPDDPKRTANFIKLNGTQGETEQDYSLKVNFKSKAVIQNVNQGYGPDCDGKVLDIEASEFNFCGGTIKNCCAAQGGAIFLNGGLLNLISGEISNCKAKDGGAIYSFGGLVKDLSSESGKLTIKSCFASDFGGAIYIMAGEACFNGLDIKSCKAGRAGGAIYGQKGGLTRIDDINIDSCSVNDVNETLSEDELLDCGGGAIANADGRQLMIKGGKMTNCSTNMNGGAILNCKGGRIAIYGGKIANCFITKNNNKILPENLSNAAKKYLGDAVCNNCSRGMVIVKSGNDFAIENLSQAKGNNMPTEICGYVGLFDRTYYETGKMSEDPKSTNADLYDESWGILLTGGEPVVHLVRVSLDDDDKDSKKGTIHVEDKNALNGHVVDFDKFNPEDQDPDLYYGPNNRGVQLTFAVSNPGDILEPKKFAISVDGGNEFYYPFEEQDKQGKPISGLSIVSSEKDGVNGVREYNVHFSGEGKLAVVAKLNESHSQVFRLWMDMSPPDRPIIDDIDGSRLESNRDPGVSQSICYDFKDLNETKYFTKEPVVFQGTGEDGCKLEIYKFAEIGENGKPREGATNLLKTNGQIGDFNYIGVSKKDRAWTTTMQHIRGVIPDSKEVKLAFVQRDKAGSVSYSSVVSVGVDMNGPTGRMKFDVLDKWFNLQLPIDSVNNLLDNLTFGLFSSEKFKVTVDAADLGSGVNSVKWLKSEKAFGSKEDLEKEIPANSGAWIGADKTSEKTWNEEGGLEGEGGTWNFEINKQKNEKFWVYARLEDISGNITYLRSDGAVFYSLMSASDLTYTKKSSQDLSSQIALRGNKNIFEKTIDGNQFGDNITTEYAQDLLKFSIKAAYLDRLDATTHKVLFGYYPFDLSENQISPDHSPFPSVDFNLKIQKATIPDGSIKIKGAKESYIYGDADFNVYVEGLPDDLKAKFEIENVEGNNVAKIDDNGNVTLTGCGKFIIKASTDENWAYRSFSTKTHIITVKPCPLSIDGFSWSSREYDATKDLVIKKSKNLTLRNESGSNNKVFNLRLDAVGNEWIAKFRDASAGQNKKAKFEENYFRNHFKLTGPDAINCYLIQPTFKANVTARKLKIDPSSIKIKSRYYDGTTKAEFSGTPKFSDGFINNEVEISKLTIQFLDPMPGQDKQVAIKDFAWSPKNTAAGNYDMSAICGQLIGKANIWVTPVTINNVPKYIPQNTVTIRGTGIPGYEIKITDSNGATVQTSQSQIKVDANGNWSATLINLKDRNNIIKVIQKDPNSDLKSKSVSKSIFVDRFDPTGWVQINSARVSTKILRAIEMNKIFNMFYSCDLGVEIFAQDKYSGVDYIKYFKSSQFYQSAEQLNNANIAWTDGANIFDDQTANASAKFNIGKKEESEKFFIYAKIKDKAGHIIYLRTDGAVLYNEISVDGNVSYTRCSKENSNVGINLYDSNIESIRLKSADGSLDKILEKGAEWGIAIDGKRQLLRFSFGNMDAQLEAGNYELEIVYRPGCLADESEDHIDMNGLPRKKINLVVNDLDLNDIDFFGDLASQDERIYGDEVNLSTNPNVTYTVERIDGNAQILERADSGIRYAKMTRIGQVKIVASYMNIYTRTKTITINKRPMTINNIYAANKEYDKTTDADYYSILDGIKIKPFNRAHSYLENKYNGLSESEKAKFSSKYSYINKKFEVVGLLQEDMDKVYVNGDGVRAKFEDHLAGRNKKVGFDGFVLCDVSGYNVAENYLFIQPARTADIDQKAIKIIDIEISDKTWDGTTDADFAKDPVINGIVEGDQVSITGKPVFADKGPGNSIPVYSGSVTLTGEDASNYTLVWPDVTANIKPVPVKEDKGDNGDNGDGNKGDNNDGGGGAPIIKSTAGENDFDPDFVNKYDDFSNSNGLASENALAENVITCLAAFLTISLLSTLTVIYIKNRNKQH